MELSITATLALVGVAFFAGLVSSIAGSGGLLTLPALLWAGLGFPRSPRWPPASCKVPWVR